MIAPAHAPNASVVAVCRARAATISSKSRSSFATRSARPSFFIERFFSALSAALATSNCARTSASSTASESGFVGEASSASSCTTRFSSALTLRFASSDSSLYCATTRDAQTRCVSLGFDSRRRIHSNRVRHTPTLFLDSIRAAYFCFSTLVPAEALFENVFDGLVVVVVVRSSSFSLSFELILSRRRAMTSVARSSCRSSSEF